MKKLYRIFLLAGLIVLSFFGGVFAQNPGDTIVVRPKEIDDALTNPGKGFTTFQRFNGDTANALNNCCGEFRPGYPFPVRKGEKGRLQNKDYPETSIAYFRFYWRYIEPQKGVYRWDIIDKALRIAHQRGQTLMLSLMPYGTEDNESSEVPDWYRKMVGEKKTWKYDNPVNKWLVNPEDPRYVKYYGGMIRALGRRYDGHPDLESVDTRIVGAWGEGGGSKLLSDSTRQALIDAYTDSFHKTSLVMMLTDEKTNKYGISQQDVGYRSDCLGDLGFWADEQDGWTHMYDYYPEGIIRFGMSDTWKRAPVTFEICGTFSTWKEREGYGAREVQYIFDQALKWHMSSFNAKSSAVPEAWKPLVAEWLKKMGYRFVLRRFSYPRQVGVNGKLHYTSWWENKGVAPIYRKYPLVLRLTGGGGSVTLLTDADVRTWMPGDNLSDGSVFIPPDLPPGDYELQLALVSPLREVGEEPEPAVKLAIEGRTRQGWYTLGKIDVTAN